MMQPPTGGGGEVDDARQQLGLVRRAHSSAHSDGDGSGSSTTSAAVGTAGCTSNTGCPIRSTVRSQYSGFNSMPMELRSRFLATMSVVPDPANGSSTVPSGGQPAAMQRRASSGGNV